MSEVSPATFFSASLGAVGDILVDYYLKENRIAVVLWCKGRVLKKRVLPQFGAETSSNHFFHPILKQRPHYAFPKKVPASDKTSRFLGSASMPWEWLRIFPMTRHRSRSSLTSFEQYELNKYSASRMAFLSRQLHPVIHQLITKVS